MKFRAALIGVAIVLAKNTVLRKKEENGYITMFGECSHVCDSLPQERKEEVYSLCDTFRKEQMPTLGSEFCETLDFADGQSYCRAGKETCYLTKRQLFDWSGCSDVYAICKAENSVVNDL